MVFKLILFRCRPGHTYASQALLTQSISPYLTKETAIHADFLELLVMLLLNHLLFYFLCLELYEADNSAALISIENQTDAPFL